jgi:hypothetical protein
MAIDYTKFATLAQTLINANGRTLTISLRPRAAADATKPWDGPNVAASTNINVLGVFDKTEQTDKKGDLVRDGIMVAYVAAADTDPALVEQYDMLTDGTDTWKIESVQIIAPGATRILYVLTLKS